MRSRLPVLLLALLCAVPVLAQDIQYQLADGWQWFERDGEALRLPCLVSHRLDLEHPEITRVVICIHGTLRNAVDYHQSMLDAAAVAGPTADSTLVISPQFLTDEDTGFHQLADALCWEYYGWRQGDQSVGGFHGPRPWDLSSFAVVDSLFLRAAAVCPNLRDAVLTGHSAGGQVTNRYAASSTVPDRLREEFGARFRGVVMNPSTYVYFSPERLREGTYDTFAVPEDVAACPGYDDYKYGLQNPNPWFTQDPDTLRSRYARRHVAHLVGELDCAPVDWYLDDSCMANYQGTYRVDRGQVYWRYLVWYFGDQLGPRQAMAVVPGVDHDHELMFHSACGLYHLFDVGECSDTPPEPLFTPVADPQLSTPGSVAASWVDHDGDGSPDLYIAGLDDANRLLRNDAENADFVDITPPLLHDTGYALATVWGDLDGDGRRDLALLNWEGPGLIARHEPDGAFTDVTPPVLQTAGPHTAADWADFDLDGDLDLFVARSDDQTNLLLENQDGALVDHSSLLADTPFSTRGCAWGDLDGDGDADLVLAESGRVRVLRNDRTGFADVTCATLQQTASYSGVALGDVDRDGDLDLYVAVRLGANRLLHNAGDFAFVDVSSGAAADQGDSRSASFADYDNDGWLDLYVANITGGDRLLRGVDGTHFSDETHDPMGLTGQSYAAAWGDHDQDGDLDLYVAVKNGTNYLYENKAAAGNHWLQVDLAQPGGNPSAVGTRIRCTTGVVGQVREVGGDETYMAQGTLTAEFGLGEAAVVDTLAIRWPGGEITTLCGVPADQRLLVDRGQTTPAPAALPATPLLEAPYPNPFNPQVTLAFALPAGGTVSLAIHDARGRLVRSLLTAEVLGAGPHAVTWQGRDDRGRPVASGVYWCRLDVDGRRDLRPVTLVK